MTACRRSAWYRRAAPQRTDRWSCTCTAGATRWVRRQGAIDLASRLAEAVGGWALVPDYRLAPEHAYPAALDDVVAVYGWLAREHGARPHRRERRVRGRRTRRSPWRSGCAMPGRRFRRRCTWSRRSATSPSRVRPRTRCRIADPWLGSRSPPPAASRPTSTPPTRRRRSSPR